MVAPPTTTFSERSTLTSFRDGSGGFRTTSYTGRSYSGYQGYSYGGQSYRQSGLSFGFGWTWNWGWGSFSFGWYYPRSYSFGFGYWPGCSSWGFGTYFGAHAIAYFTGHHSWSIVAYPSYWGYSQWGRYCYYPRLWHRHRYCHDGIYFVVHRPYWYDYSYWWDYRPYRYGYSRYVYENLYEDGYNDGYDKGYNRGYETGAEDTSAYRDGRNRESLNRPSRAERESDRERGSAREEFAYELERGRQAFAAGDYEAATKAFKEAVILDPSDAGAKLNLAVAAFASGKYAFAAFGLRRGLALNPDASRQDYDLRQFYRHASVFTSHMAELDAAIAKDADADKLLVQGYVRLFSGDAEGASASLERAIALAPQDAAARALYAAALEKIEKK